MQMLQFGVFFPAEDEVKMPSSPVHIMAVPWACRKPLCLYLCLQTTSVVTGTQPESPFPQLIPAVGDSQGCFYQLKCHFKDTSQRFAFCWRLLLFAPLPPWCFNSCLQHPPCLCFLSFSHSSSYFSPNCSALLSYYLLQELQPWREHYCWRKEMMLLKYMLKKLFNVMATHTYKGKKKKKKTLLVAVSFQGWINGACAESPWIYLNTGLGKAAPFGADDTKQPWFWVWSRGSWQDPFQVGHIRPPANHKQQLREMRIRLLAPKGLPPALGRIFNRFILYNQIMIHPKTVTTNCCLSPRLLRPSQFYRLWF